MLRGLDNIVVVSDWEPGGRSLFAEPQKRPQQRHLKPQFLHAKIDGKLSFVCFLQPIMIDLRGQNRASAFQFDLEAYRLGLPGLEALTGELDLDRDSTEFSEEDAFLWLRTAISGDMWPKSRVIRDARIFVKLLFRRNIPS